MEGSLVQVSCLFDELYVINRACYRTVKYVLIDHVKVTDHASIHTVSAYINTCIMSSNQFLVNARQMNCFRELGEHIVVMIYINKSFGSDDI